ncbi:hypothetical protein Rhow_000533 [Rhodococcus wratislaviensis]|uniref:Uncharacterized protein n=1 Tax=Rhodococcus wratislaviensis TaxID=44752 RepID=A0A402CMQ1_RHOWR|nr:hypothetical protein Rhow_000533 [Rhodococcus wratislaviensis]
MADTVLGRTLERTRVRPRELHATTPAERWGWPSPYVATCSESP